jgi:hypothetical protein
LKLLATKQNRATGTSGLCNKGRQKGGLLFPNIDITKKTAIINKNQKLFGNLA